MQHRRRLRAMAARTAPPQRQQHIRSMAATRHHHDSSAVMRRQQRCGGNNASGRGKRALRRHLGSTTTLVAPRLCSRSTAVPPWQHQRATMVALHLCAGSTSYRHGSTARSISAVPPTANWALEVRTPWRARGEGDAGDSEASSSTPETRGPRSSPRPPGSSSASAESFGNPAMVLVAALLELGDAVRRSSRRLDVIVVRPSRARGRAIVATPSIPGAPTSPAAGRTG